jgi:hypothetical protein
MLLRLILEVDQWRKKSAPKMARLKGGLAKDRFLVLTVGLRRRRAGGLGFGRFFRLIFLSGLLEFPDRLAKAFGETGEFGTTKKEEDDGKDRDELRSAEA